MIKAIQDRDYDFSDSQSENLYWALRENSMFPDVFERLLRNDTATDVPLLIGIYEEIQKLITVARLKDLSVKDHRLQLRGLVKVDILLYMKIDALMRADLQS